MKQLPWVAFYSQTGSEIVNICKALDIKPEVVVTNNPKKTAYENYEFFRDNGITIIYLPFNPVLNDYIKVFYITSHIRNCIISLNGWMRVIPPEMCSVWYGKIYNGHPGLINVALTNFDKVLIGKNPQKKAFDLKREIVGSVVHEVTEKVDEGKVITYAEASMKADAILDDYYSTLKETSLIAWIKFFNQYKHV